MFQQVTDGGLVTVGHGVEVAQVTDVGKGINDYPRPNVEYES